MWKVSLTYSLWPLNGPWCLLLFRQYKVSKKLCFSDSMTSIVTMTNYGHASPILRRPRTSWRRKLRERSTKEIVFSKRWKKKRFGQPVIRNFLASVLLRCLQFLCSFITFNESYFSDNSSEKALSADHKSVRTSCRGVSNGNSQPR